MDCSELLDTFSDYRDRRLDPAERARVEGHLQRCPSCRRYRRVIDEGVRTLRELPAPPVPDDFRPRLRHRIFHLEDGDALGRDATASGVSGTAAVAMALLLALAAWGPALQDRTAEVTLAPVVVDEPPAAAVRGGLPASAFFGSDGPPEARLGARAATETWGPPRSLLLEASYDPLAVERYTVVRPWLD